MALSLNLFTSLLPWRRKDPHAAELYGAIVARTRLPVFYQGFGVPDTLEGRFVVLSLHLFAVLHRLKSGGAQALQMAQDLADHFTTDMETVLREIGIGDLKIPKKVRGLASSGAALLQDYEAALSNGDDALTATIARALPQQDPSDGQESSREDAAKRLAAYLRDVIRHVEAEPVEDLCAGTLSLPPATVPQERRS
jgi:cytochrome b pre-mRNA-processing protein 3